MFQISLQEIRWKNIFQLFSLLSHGWYIVSCFWRSERANATSGRIAAAYKRCLPSPRRSSGQGCPPGPPTILLWPRGEVEKKICRWWEYKSGRGRFEKSRGVSGGPRANALCAPSSLPFTQTHLSYHETSWDEWYGMDQARAHLRRFSILIGRVFFLDSSDLVHLCACADSQGDPGLNWKIEIAWWNISVSQIQGTRWVRLSM